MKNAKLMSPAVLIFKFLFLSCSLFMLASGCATTGTGEVEGVKRIPVLTSIGVKDGKLDIVVDSPFTYTIYKSSDPYKVIAEIPDVRLGIPRKVIPIGASGITEIIPSQIEEPPGVRLEILLSSPVSVEPMYGGEAHKDVVLSIKVREDEIAAAPEVEKIEEQVKEVKGVEAEKPEQKAEIPTAEIKEAPTVAEAMPKEFPPATSVVDLKAEKSQDVLKVVIKGNGSLSPNVFRLDNRAILDMPNVIMAAPLPAAIPPPLKGIRAGKHTDKARLVFDMKEGTSFDVAAIEDSVIVTFRLPEKERYAAKAAGAETKTAEGETRVAEVPALAPEEPAEGKYKGQKISLDFQDADIRPIFRLLADISGYNFVIDPSVQGKITMKLLNVPWDQALDIILQTFTLGKSIEGNIVWIAPTTMFTKMAEDKMKARVAVEVSEELTQEIIRVNYATAGELSGAISQGKLLSTRGSVTIDARMNTLIIKDTPTSIGKMKELVKIMDVAKPQVMIEAKIVEVSSDYSESFGIRWGGAFSTQTWPATLGGDFSVNTPTAGAGSDASNPGGVMALTIGSASTLSVDLSLSALESINKSRRLSNPKILTMDNEAATINQGTSIPVQTVSAEGTKTEYVNATLSLAVTPRIAPDGYIYLKINASNNALGILTPQGYAIDTKTVSTQALVKNGETLVIGGIYTTGTLEGTEGIPLLSRIPIIGWLFKTKTQSGPSVKELLVFITPVIVKNSK
ncbi:MAG: type IV pilus secretin PilQ [Nitrospirae bacterium]|nr:type IV pilus secretin PilQ [Nitrospirota bacterium]